MYNCPKGMNGISGTAVREVALRGIFAVGGLEGGVDRQHHVEDLAGRTVEGDRVRAHPKYAAKLAPERLDALHAGRDLMLAPDPAEQFAVLVKLRGERPSPRVVGVPPRLGPELADYLGRCLLPALVVESASDRCREHPVDTVALCGRDPGEIRVVQETGRVVGGQGVRK
jgi:hypothetical protein